MIGLTSKSGQVTAIAYYQAGQANAGLPYRETGPTGLNTYFDYNARGQLTRVWGEARYPESRGYNDFGDLVALITYRGGANWDATNWAGVTTGTGDTNAFSYHEPTGLLVGRTDAAGLTASYSYYDNHLPRATIWARGTGMLREYSANLDLVKISYTNAPASAPVVVEYQQHDRFGLRARSTTGRGSMRWFTITRAGWWRAVARMGRLTGSR